MVNILFHCFFITSIIFHICLPLLDEDFIETFHMMINEEGWFLFRLWCRSSYGWATLRDGLMIVSSISTMITLKVSFIWMTQLSDSTLYESINESLFSFIPQRKISIRRWQPARFRKFRCVLI